MARNPIVDFFHRLRRLFGNCPCCDTVFRLSDCNIYHQTKPEADWKNTLDKQREKLDSMEEKITEKIEAAREVAHESGRKVAKKLIKKIDPVFSPLRRDASHAKMLFHPVDLLVFKGMQNDYIKNIIFLDQFTTTPAQLQLQNSVINCKDNC
jgi:predicted Holliday junction resolvase-like endonuclease